MSDAHGGNTTDERAGKPEAAVRSDEDAREVWIRTAIAQVILDSLGSEAALRSPVEEALRELGYCAGAPEAKLHLLPD